MNLVAAVVAATENPSYWSYVLVCWAVVFVTVAAYAAWTITRGRRIVRRLPAEDRRWM